MSDADIKKTSVLAGSFSEYIVRHPETMDAVPRGAYIILTSKSDLSITRKNLALARKHGRKNHYRAEKIGRVWRVTKFIP